VIGKYWMHFNTPAHLRGNDKPCGVSYGAPYIGFSQHEGIDEHTQDLLKIAIEVGKEEMREQFRKMLGVNV